MKFKTLTALGDRSFVVACENISFSSLFPAGDVSRGGTSATQWQKFHTDDADQFLHKKSGSHGWDSKYKFVQFYVSSGRFWYTVNRSPFQFVLLHLNLYFPDFQMLSFFLECSAYSPIRIVALLSGLNVT